MKDCHGDEADNDDRHNCDHNTSEDLYCNEYDHGGQKVKRK